MDTAFEYYNPEQLESMEHFFMNVRKSNGERYGTRYLKSPPYRKKFEIGKDTGFAHPREKFNAAIVELKMVELGDVEHYPAINETGRRKLYTSLYQSSKIREGFKIKFNLTFALIFVGEGMKTCHKRINEHSW